ncbi:glycosyltransferase [Ramlibacter sp. AN1015]|uniref:glycosyltransferase n=1 Tax=Ramlibacter sp. AN1015 TaxID=3133428 RepID=UPI0030C07961
MKPLPETPLVSIITPSYNTGRFIEETLRSVQVQDYPRIEHIVLDSWSTDQTPEILERFPSVRLIRPAPPDLTGKMNMGIMIAKGDIVSILCADDYLLPGAVTKAVNALKQNKDIAIVYCNFLSVDENSVEIERLRSKQASFRDLVDERNWIPSQTAFIRREAVECVGTFQERYMHVCDWDLFIRISKLFAILYVDDSWGAARVRKGQMSDVHKYAFWRQARWMTRGHGAPFFSRLFLDFWQGKLVRAAAMLRSGHFAEFKSKLRDLINGFAHR